MTRRFDCLFETASREIKIYNLYIKWEEAKITTYDFYEKLSSILQFEVVDVMMKNGVLKIYPKKEEVVSE